MIDLVTQGEKVKALSITLFAGLVGCAFLQPVSAAETTTFKVVWSFSSGADGSYPRASLTDVNGALYGTTAEGGGAGCGGSGCGTVFSFDPNTGTEKVLYSFCSRANCKDGAIPEANLIDVNNTLYGTTESGGRSTSCGNSYGCGTVFALDSNTGAEKVLYSFCTYPICTDGWGPNASLTAAKGMLYGTTFWGGTAGSGTAFSFDPRRRAEYVLHSFCTRANCADGEAPYAGLTAMNGTLYGTTTGGGNSGCRHFTTSCGMLFSLDPSTGAETVLYAFCSQQNCSDGGNPAANLIAVNGKLYGTTYDGGMTGCVYDGCGTVFSFDPNTGVEKVLYAFCQQQDCADGANPLASVIDVKGILYGTTAYGGRTGCPQTGDCGTVFSVDPNTGTETVLYAFCSRKNCTDGWAPTAGVITVRGKLYGTTSEGGAYGFGTVFAIAK